jgi:DNA-binding ferritin-like protein
MENIAIILRFLQLYAHQAHNLAKGQTFFSDHEFFNKLYHEYEEEYDSIVERCLGLGISCDIRKVNNAAAKNLPDDNSLQTEKCLAEILKQEKNLCAQIEGFYLNMSVGSQQLIGSIADNSEKRQYFIKRRLLK